MVTDVVISAENLGKKYIIGHQSERERYASLRDVMARNARIFSRTIKDLIAGRPNVVGDEIEELWALKDLSFEVRRGDVVGIIGRNGAGKSTLLKILSRITEPSTGFAKIKGRVASLLEVGTGFHPELSGRENIYLNGSLLGMTRLEIRRKFDEIVAFADIERFLDTPVKRYSSGMYVRLAFAVAAHLEPEILIVDEVLAVGDAEFQKKCLGKMSVVATEGRTVLFVSHNMSAIRGLCNSAILLRDGAKAFQGDVSTALNHYAKALPESSVFTSSKPRRPRGVYLIRCSMEQETPTDSCLALRLGSEREATILIHMFLADRSGVPVGFATAGGLGTVPVLIRAGESEVRLGLNLSRLAKGHYFVSVRIDAPGNECLEMHDNILAFEHLPPLIPGCAEVLQQQWGYGCLHLESKILSEQSLGTAGRSDGSMRPVSTAR